MKKRLFVSKFLIVISVLMLIIVSGCNCENTGSAGGKRIYNISLSATELNIGIGQEKKLYATYGEGFTLTFESSDESIVTVSTDGTIKGIKAGSAEIIVKTDGKNKICKVNVVDEKYEVKLDFESVKMVVGSGKKIYCTLYKNGIEISGTAVWSVTPQVNNFEQNGNSVIFYAESVGEYTITASYNGASATCRVSVISAS